MKFRPCNQSGNVLLIALATTSIIGVALASYLSLTAAQNTSTARSQSWNLAIPAAESGIEEALTHLYYNGQSNLAVNGWTLATDGSYTKQFTMGDTYYVVSMDGTRNPIIKSE